MEEIKRIYLSGPVTGMTNSNYKEFIKAKIHYESLGKQVINPLDVAKNLELIYSDNKLKSPSEYNIIGEVIASMCRCHAVILLEGWQKSKGCSHEIALASQYNIPIFEAFTDEPIYIDAKIKLAIKQPILTQ